MSIAFFSQRLESITQSEHAYYYPVQTVLFGGISGLGAFCFTSIPFTKAFIFTATAYIINQYSAPIFAELFEPYRNYSLGPMIGQVINITVSLGTASLICKIVGQTLTIKQISQISFSFFLTLFISHIILHKCRQKI